MREKIVSGKDYFIWENKINNLTTKLEDKIKSEITKNKIKIEKEKISLKKILEEDSLSLEEEEKKRDTKIGSRSKIRRFFKLFICY